MVGVHSKHRNDEDEEDVQRNGILKSCKENLDGEQLERVDFSFV
jgi:hypothetical protein